LAHDVVVVVDIPFCSRRLKIAWNSK